MSERVLKVNQLIKRELSQIILKEIDFRENVLVTITRVETSANLIQSKVFVSVMPAEKTIDVLRTLNGQVYFLQQKLNKLLKMRPIPKIIFLQEKRTGEAAEIERILENLKKEGK